MISIGLFFPGFYPDATFLILVPGLILAMYAQFKVQGTFAKYVRVQADSGMTGSQVAKRLLEDAGINDVSVEQTKGRLTDHFDPKAKALRLSPDVYSGASLASLGVAAHEAGHAMQHNQGYLPLGVRAAFVPVAQFGSTLAFPLFLIGFIFNTGWLAWAGIYLFSAVVIFQLVTLPVEFNASNRALASLQSGGYISGQEATGAKKVLDAAALTYVAAAIMGILQLLRLLILVGGFGRRDD